FLTSGPALIVTILPLEPLRVTSRLAGSTASTVARSVVGSVETTPGLVAGGLLSVDLAAGGAAAGGGAGAAWAATGHGLARSRTADAARAGAAVNERAQHVRMN